MILYCANTSAINIYKNLVLHAKTKHIAIKYHYVRELVEDKQVKIANIFTKQLPKDAYEYLRGKLGVKTLTQVA